VYGKLENYEIDKKIGKGQFSVVYRARCIAAAINSSSDGNGEDDVPVVALKKVQIFEMMDAKARLDCMKEIQLLQVGDDCHYIHLQFYYADKKMCVNYKQLKIFSHISHSN